uniref:Putative methyltransferase n=1 Tax=viral metagenome TaxID=1070528 RepID=A0A6M3LM69_9ZZZZ
MSGGDVNDLVKWEGIREITVSSREDLPKVKPALFGSTAIIKVLKARGDFKALFDISEWQAILKRQAGRFVSEMEKAQGRRTDLELGSNMIPSSSTYRDLGFTKLDARRWYLHYIIPEKDFKAYRDKRLEELKPLAQHDLLEIGKKTEREMKQRDADERNPVLDERILVGRFQDLGSQIADGSVHLILTDPPYEWKEGMELDDLAQFASEKLMVGGAFLCYIGQTQLPYAMDAFRRYLRYWWTIACLHSGAANLMQRYGVRATWKPILMFVKETRHNTDRIFLDRVSGGEEKEDDPSEKGVEWKQAVGEAEYLIEKLCPEDGLVVDPCLGSGTVAVAAETLRRRWIGIEVDRSTAEAANRRISR